MNLVRMNTSAALTLFLAHVIVGASAANAQGTKSTTDDKLSTTKATLEQLSKTRRLISAEKRAWTQQRQTLRERRGMIEREIEALRAKLVASRTKLEAASKKKQGLTEKLASLDEGTQVLKKAIASLESRARKLTNRLPAPILGKIGALIDAIPKDPEKTKLNLSQRYSFVTGILDQVNKFHREVTTVPEVRETSDGKKVAVTTVYLGCGQAFYASEKSAIAGIGTASADTWVWVPRNDAVDAIRKILAIVRGEKTAEVVPVPVRIQ